MITSEETKNDAEDGCTNPTVDRDFLMLMLSDSNLPTGGFIASSGMESAITQSPELLANPQELKRFVKVNLNSHAHTMIPALVKSYHAAKSVNTPDETLLALQNLLEIDLFMDASMRPNIISREASRKQGIAFLTLATRSFLPRDSLLKQYKLKLRLNETAGHLSVVFGLFCSKLGLGTYDTVYLLLFMHVRSLLSAAVRLNILGPYKVQEILQCFSDDIKDLSMELSDSRDIAESFNTCLLLDLLQCSHNRLYSRLFNS
jgi:urease accessory protein